MTASRLSAAWAVLLVAGAPGCGREVPRAERILLVTLDTTRADRLGCYGHGGGTSPFLDRLAREEAVVFEQAVAPTPTTLSWISSAKASSCATTTGFASPIPFDAKVRSPT